MPALIGPSVIRRLVATRSDVDLPVVEKVLEAYDAVIEDLLDERARIRFIGGSILSKIDTKPMRKLDPRNQTEVLVPSKVKLVLRVPRRR